VWQRTKLDPKSRKCIFLGYADNVKEYRLWDPTAHKVVVSKDVVFAENELQRKKKNDSTSKETVIVHMEEKSKESDSSEAESVHEKQEPDEINNVVRRSTRQTHKPSWQSDYVMTSHYAYCLLTEEGEPSTIQEALNGSDASQWVTTMHEEMEALHRNKTCDLIELPKGRKVNGYKWVYEIKHVGNDQMERYR
jgi:hypothetical protein